MHAVAAFRPRQICLAVAVVCGTGIAAMAPVVHAQLAQPSEVKAESNDVKKKKEEIVVLGNPLGSTDARDVVSPVSSLSGDELLMKRGNTLGDTLNGLPGVSATWFGPNAGRPVIRGLDGDRIRVLTNLGSSLDASSLSFDHNPAIDPLIIERVEVLRGPAALLYGGTAIGGVVNVIDNRIPASPIDGPRGAVEVRQGGADRERSSGALLEAGNGTISLHADAFQRETDDYRVPASTGVRSPVVNSAASANGGAIGGSVQFADGKASLGVSHSTYQSRYGTVAEEDVRIEMSQTRTAAELILRDLAGSVVEGAFVKASKSEYLHTEFEGDIPGTVFKNTGSDVRAEVKHARIGSMQGVFGIQSEQFTFSALGDEAFVPETQTRNRGYFLYEEIPAGPYKFSLGARAEQSEVASRGATAGVPNRFGAPDTRRFSLASASAGLSYKATSATTVTLNFARNERAPTYYELFADGPHVATAAYEVGNRNIRPESATSVDLGLSWRSANGANTATIGLFVQSFARFLALRKTGVDRDSLGNAHVTACVDGTSLESGCVATVLPEYQYQAVSAKLSGIEAQSKMRIVGEGGIASSIPGLKLDLRAKLDYVKAEDRTNGEPLPRVAPLRFGLGTTMTLGRLMFATDIERTAKQSRTPPAELRGAVAGHTLIGASLMYGLPLSAGRTATFFVRGSNLGNSSAFNAASIDTIRYLSPLPGRSIKAGVRVDF